MYTLAAVQFTHVLDFMIMMPLGAGLMRVFAIGPEQFGNLVASYGLAAAVSGFLGGFVLDRFERKRALLALYAAFTLATLGCAVAPTYGWLLLARIAAGAFGGVASGVVTAMVADAIPAERRGQAMATVMAAFPLSSVLGVPLGLLLAGWFEWHAPFFLLAGLGVAVFFVARRVLPVVPRTLSQVHPVRQMGQILAHPVHLRAFVLSALLVFAGGCVIPFMAPSLVANVGLPEQHLPYVYFCGGACVFFTMPWFGRLSDRHDKLHVLAAISAVAVGVVLVLTRLGPGPVVATLLVTSLFFVSMSGRFSPAMAMVSNAVDGRYRGGFMSVNSAIQQAATGCATLLAGRLVTAGPGGGLIGYPRLGYLAAALFALTVLAAAWLRAAAPHAARNPAPAGPLPEG